MPALNDAPVIDETVVCIVDRENIELAAIISSYFDAPGTYFPLFTFPGIREGQEAGGEDDEDRIPQMIGAEAAIHLRNILAHLSGFQTLLLAGLSAAQRSYIDLQAIACERVLQVGTADEVDHTLRSIGVQKEETLRCRPDEVLRGLFEAKLRGCRLWIAKDADPLPENEIEAGRLVVVEQTQETAGSVVAVNYAHAVGAALKVVQPLPRYAESRSVELIQRWRGEGDRESWRELFDAMTERIGDVDFERFNFATFFTEGLPYALFVSGATPCSYVSLGLFPDRLIVNAILREREQTRLASAVVFATEAFHDHDESQWLIAFMRRYGYAVRGVVGAAATVVNFEYHAEQYPYDLLHISTHGVEVKGTLETVTFLARDKSQHVVEYDHVLGIARTYDGSGLFNVQQKFLFKSLDGAAWGSPELRERNLPDFVYSDALKAMKGGKSVVNRQRLEKEHVPGGHAIICNDGYHLGMFRILAGYCHPVVFNNTCSSWSGVNHFFLSGGAIAYIGTHWDVPDEVAIRSAKRFYEAAIDAPLGNAVDAMNRAVASTPDANIYAFWGLHFSTFSRGENIRLSLNDVGSKQAKLINMYTVHLETAALDDDVRDNEARVLRLLIDDFGRTFRGPNVASIIERAEAVLATIPVNVDESAE